MSIKSLKARDHDLSATDYQLEVLNGEIFSSGTLPTFRDKLGETSMFPLKPTAIEIFQMNLAICAIKPASTVMWMQALTGRRS